ncbi:TPA: PI-2a pilus assembly sortase SrtC4, partial [Streptococcus agalactiae]
MGGRFQKNLKKSVVLNRWMNVGLILLFLVGLLITSYPFISNWYYNIKANNQVTNFDNQTQKLNAKEINRRFELAKAYNRTLDPSRLSDPYTEKEKKGIAEYAHMLEIAEMI